jgi:hypothetical protein
MDTLRVLFVGNSHTFYNDMPALFKKLAEADGNTRAEVTMQAHPGVTWGWHLKQGTELRYALVHGHYDYAILQQAAHSPAPPAEDTLRDGKEIIRLAKSCGVRPVVVIPWAEQRFPEHQAIMYNTYNKLIREQGVQGSPVGYVFERVQRERPDIGLYWFDGEHCSPYGSYVNAASAYAVIFGKSPKGLPPAAFCSPQGNAADFGIVQKAMDQLRELTHGFNEAEMAKPENAAILGKVMGEYGAKFPYVWDRDKLDFVLETEKCSLLQEWVWEAVQSFASSPGSPQAAG